MQSEIGKVLGLLKTSMPRPTTTSPTCSSRAKGELHESLKAEQVRIIISYLMIENDKMRSRTSDLQANLETLAAPDREAEDQSRRPPRHRASAIR